MQEFLEYVLRLLIDHPDEMRLTRVDPEPGQVIFRLRLRPSDVGKVMGKQGHTIGAIRNLLAASARHGEKAVLQIVEEGEFRAAVNPAPAVGT